MTAQLPRRLHRRGGDSAAAIKGDIWALGQVDSPAWRSSTFPLAPTRNHARADGCVLEFGITRSLVASTPACGSVEISLGDLAATSGDVTLTRHRGRGAGRAR